MWFMHNAVIRCKGIGVRRKEKAVKLIEWLKETGTTQEELAELAGISQTSVSRACRGECSPDSARRIYRATKGCVTPTDLFILDAA